MRVIVACLAALLAACGSEPQVPCPDPPCAVADGGIEPDGAPPGVDTDGDGVPDLKDNCPSLANADQADADHDGVGDACQKDGDGDKVPDATDNCPDAKNPDQEDYDADGKGDACTPQDGTSSKPFIISVNARHFTYSVTRDTTGSPSDAVDKYPPSTVDESGPEHFYVFRLKEAARVTAEVRAPEPTGVDIDVHLLKALSPLELLERSNLVTYGALAPGVYYLSLDSCKGLAGPYNLDVAVRPTEVQATETFNAYVLKAVKQLASDYGLLGYDDVALTHDLDYGGLGVIKATAPPRTMCVAAMLEVLVTAMQIYAQERKDASVFDFLPVKSWQSLSSPYIRAHLWVNPTINARGSADALRHFGMGMTVPFKELTPGSFINLNRTTGTGHAVVFLSFIDIKGTELPAWSPAVVGFKYFSSQGGFNAGAGGLDYRYAVFEQHGAPTMPYKSDIHVIESEDQLYLNTGIVYSPSLWLATTWSRPVSNTSDRMPFAIVESVFDAKYMSGVTLEH